MADPNKRTPTNPLGGTIPGHQAKGKHQANVIKNQAEISSFDDSQSERMQVDQQPNQPPKLTFRFAGQEQKRTMTVDEFKKLCGNSSRLFDVMKYKGKYRKPWPV